MPASATPGDVVNDSAPTLPERVALTDRQYRALFESHQKLALLKQQTVQLESEAQTVLELLMEFHGLPIGTPLGLDEATKSLVVNPQPVPGSGA